MLTSGKGATDDQKTANNYSLINVSEPKKDDQKIDLKKEEPAEEEEAVNKLSPMYWYAFYDEQTSTDLMDKAADELDDWDTKNDH